MPLIAFSAGFVWEQPLSWRTVGGKTHSQDVWVMHVGWSLLTFIFTEDVIVHSWRWMLCHSSVIAYLSHMSFKSFDVTEDISTALAKKKLSDTSALFYCLSVKWQDTPMINRVAVTIRSSNSLAVLAAFMRWIIFLSSKLFKEQWQHAELVTMCLCLWFHDSF